MARTDIQQLVIPAHLQDVLSMIASKEERSMSATVRVLIVKRAQELGIAIDPSDEPETVKIHA